MGDIAIQRHETTIAAGSASTTLTLGSPVGSLDHAFARLLNVTPASYGDGVNNNIEDHLVTVELTATDTVTVRRATGARTINVVLEVWEDTSAGGASGFTVLHHGEHAFTGTSSSITHDTAGTTAGQIVPVLCGVRFSNTGTCKSDRFRLRIRRNSTTATDLHRFDGTDTVTASVAVLEFGADWTIGQLLGTTNGVSKFATWTIPDVTDWAQTIAFGSWLCDGGTGMDDTQLVIYPGSGTSTQIKTWHDEASRTHELAIYTCRHPDLVVEHDDTIDGSLTSSTWRPTHTITEPTDHDATTGLIGYAASSRTDCAFAAAFLGYRLDNSTTWRWLQGASVSSGQEPELAIQVADFDAVEAATGAAAASGGASTAGAVTAATLGGSTTVPALNVLWCGGSSSYAGLAVGDKPFADRLIAAGHTLTYLDLDGTPPVASPTVETTAAELAAAASGADLVVIASSWKPWALADDALDALAIPVLIFEGYYLNDCALAAGSAGETSTTYTDVDIIRPSHELAGALTGTVTVLSTAQRLTFANVSDVPAGADVIATPAGDSTRAVIYGIDTGVTLAGSTVTAVARRVVVFPNYDAGAVITADGYTLLDAAVAWLAGVTGAAGSGSSGSSGASSAGATANALGDDGAIAPAVRYQLAPGTPTNVEPLELPLVGALGHWAFDEESGNAADTSGNGNDFTLYGSPANVDPAVPLGPVRAKRFAITTQGGYQSAGPDVGADFAVATWVRVSSWVGSSSGTNGDPVFAVHESWGSAGWRFWFDFGTGAGAGEVAQLRITNSATFTSNIAYLTDLGLDRDDFADAAGTWLHVVANYRRSDGASRLYVNGVAVTDWVAIGALVQAPGNAAIASGWRGPSGDATWLTDLGELMFMPRLLTDAEIAALAANHRWLDVTDRVRHSAPSSIKRGRSSDLELSYAGTNRWRLDNRDRRFEPEHAGSTWHPHILPLMQAREVARWHGVDHELFTGYVLDFTPGYPSANTDAVIDLPLVDAFHIASSTPVSGGYLPAWLRANANARHWPLHQTDGLDEVLADGLELLPVGSTSSTSIEYASEPLGAADSVRRYLRLTNALTGYLRTASPGEGLETSGPLWMSALVRWDDTLTPYSTPSIVVLNDSSAGSITAAFRVKSNGEVSYFHDSGPTYYEVVVANPATIAGAGFDLVDGAWHHVLVARTETTDPYTLTLYVDGVLVTAVATSGAPVPGTDADTRAQIGYGWPGHLGEVTIAHGTITDEQVAELYDALRNVLPGASPGDRIDDLAEYLELPPARLDLDVGSAAMPTRDLSGKKVLTAMQDAAAADFGMLFVAGDGRLTFHSRAHRADQTEPRAVLGDLSRFADYRGEVLGEIVDTPARVLYVPFGDANPPADVGGSAGGWWSSPAVEVVPGARPGQNASRYPHSTYGILNPIEVTEGFYVGFALAASKLEGPAQSATRAISHGAFTAGAYYGFDVIIWTTGNVTIRWYTAPLRDDYITAAGTIDLTLNRWSHLAVRHNGDAAATADVIVDGEIVHTFDIATDYRPHAGGSTLSIPTAWSSLGTFEFDLDIAELVVIDEPVTDDVARQIATRALRSVDVDLATFTPRAPSERLRNVVAIPTVAGDGASAVDTASIGQYGPRPLNRSALDVEAGTVLTSLAEHLVSALSTPRLHVARVTCNPLQNPAEFTTLLGLEVGDRVTLLLAPFDERGVLERSGRPMEFDAFIEAVEVRHDTIEWAFAFALSPAATSLTDF